MEIQLLGLLCASLAVMFQVSTSDTGCGGKPADILFLLDCSSSIWGPNFKKQLQFVRNVVDEFDVTLSRTRIGVMTYGSYVSEEIALGQYVSKGSLSNTINSIHQMRGDTRTDKALDRARSILTKQGRDGVPQLVIVMTDGLSDFPELTRAAAEKLHQSGVFAMTIGIGDAADKNELHSIASQTDVVFKVDTYDALKRLKKILAFKACEVKVTTTGTTVPSTIRTKPTKGCGGKPADVVFALDSSSSIWGPDFDTQLRFIQDIVGVFDISPETTHVGLLTFGSVPENHFQLDKFLTEEDIVDTIGRIEQTRGETNTAAALRDIRRHFFSARHSPRDSIVRIAIIVTDGRSDHPLATSHEATLLRDSGVHVFAVGVGQDIDMGELHAIASKPAEDYVNTVDNYDALNSIKELLAIKACQVTDPPTTPTTTTTTATTTTTTPEPMPADQGCGASSPADVVFSLPPEARTQDTEKTLRFIRDLIQEFDIANDKVRMGLVPRDCLAVPGLNLQSGQDKKKLLEMFDFEYQAATVPRVIKYMRKQSFMGERGTRGGAKNIGVVIIDSNSPDLEATALEAQKARETSDIELFVVAVGKEVSDAEMKAIASLPHDHHILTASNYDDLPRLVSTLKERIDDLCNGL